MSVPMNPGEPLQVVEPEVRLDLSGDSSVTPDGHDLSVKMQQLGATWNEERRVWEVPGGNLRVALALSPRLKLAGITPVVRQPLTPAPPEPAATTTTPAPPTNPQGKDEEIGESEWDAAYERELHRRQEALTCVVSSLRCTLDQLLANANDASSTLRILVGELLANYVTKLVGEAEGDVLPSTTEQKQPSWPFLARWPILMAFFKDRELIDKVCMMQQALEELNQEIIDASGVNDRAVLEQTLADAVEVLTTWGQEARPCLRQLVELLRGTNMTDAITSTSGLALLHVLQEIATDDDAEAIEVLLEILNENDSEDFREKAGEVLGKIGRLNALRELFEQIEATYHWERNPHEEGTFFPIFQEAVRSIALSIGSQAVPVLVEAMRDGPFVFTSVNLHKVPEVAQMFEDEIGLARQRAAAHALAWFLEDDPDLVDEEVREKVELINNVEEE